MRGKLNDALIQSFNDHRTRPAVAIGRSPARTVSFAELANEIEIARARLSTIGFRPGGLVVISLLRTVESMALALAILREGGTFAWLPPRIPAPRIRRLLDGIAPFALVVDDKQVSLAETLPDFQVLRMGGGGALDIVSRPSAPPELSECDGAACLLFTSGTTGAPKRVLVDSDDLLRRARGEGALFELTTSDRVLSLLPFSFDVGLNQWISSLIAGAQLCVADVWLRLDVAAIAADRGVTAIAGVPSLWVAALDGDPDAAIFPEPQTIRFVTISGGSLPLPAIDRLKNGLGPRIRIHKTYGQTETFRSTALLDVGDLLSDERARSVGRALPGVELAISDGVSFASVGVRGEILHGGVGTMRGYLGDPVATATKLRTHPVTQRKMIFTGDDGYLDSEGYLYLEGRQDGMIKTASIRFYPREVEEVLSAHPAVREVAAFAVPDAHLGERVAVAVVTGPPGSTAQELRAFSGQRLPPQMVPATVLVVASLPRTTSGKPDLVELRSLYDNRRPRPAMR